MYKKLKESKGGLLAYKLKGIFTKNEYENLLDEIEVTSKGHHSISLILEFEDLRETPHVLELVSDDRFGLKFHNKLSRFACVARPKWRRWWERFTTLFSKPKIKFFTPKQRFEALNWVQQ